MAEADTDVMNDATPDSGNAATPNYEDITVPSTWGNPDVDEFNRHFTDHAADFGATTWDDYANQANQFYQQFQNENLPAVEGPDGVVRVYEPETNTFGVYNSDGTTATFFKPDDGVSYYQAQIGRDVGAGGNIINPLNEAGPENSPYSGVRVEAPPLIGGGGGGGGGLGNRDILGEPEPGYGKD